MAVVATTKAVSLTKKKARPKTITKKGPGIFVECGKVRLGTPNDWVKLNTPSPIKLPDVPLIGIWGVVKKADKKLKEIAEQVYGDATMVRFIVDANCLNGTQVFKGKELFIPNINKNSLQKSNKILNSHYQFIGFNMSEVKPIIQNSGDVYVTEHQANVKEYFFSGKDHRSKLFSNQPPLSYKAYVDEMQGISDAAKPSINYMKDSLKAGLEHDNAIDAGIGAKGVFKNGKYIQSKMSSNNNWVYKVADGADDFSKTNSWIGKGIFARRFWASNFTKGNIVAAILMAGVKTFFDWDEHHSLNHALYTGGKTFVKGLTASAIGSAAGVLALCIPGVGWIVAGCIAVVVGFTIASGLDYADEQIEKNGIIPDWAKLDEPTLNVNKLIFPK